MKRCGVEDMTRLAYLHEPGVLRNLKSRYGMNEIYVSLVVQHISSSHAISLMHYLSHKHPQAKTIGPDQYVRHKQGRWEVIYIRGEERIK